MNNQDLKTEIIVPPIKTESNDVDYVKIGGNPILLVCIIRILLYFLGKAHGNNNKPSY